MYEVVHRFIAICGIVDHYCLNILFITTGHYQYTEILLKVGIHTTTLTLTLHCRASKTFDFLFYSKLLWHYDSSK